MTLDNASNNDTFMAKLEEELCRRNISFDSVYRRIQCVFFKLFFFEGSMKLNQTIDRCFPHIVNLACKAILTAIARACEASGSEDPVGAVCTLVCTVSIIMQSG